LDTFSIVFICTGNRFRSPLTEAFLRRLTEGLPVTVQSFGSLRVEDAPPLPEAIEIARSCGIDLAGHRARYVSDASLSHADLVLGFEDSHVRQAVVEADASRDRSFTIRHFARLLEAVDHVPRDDVVASARSAVEQAALLVARDPSGQRQDAMSDPFGAPVSLQLKTAAEIRELSLMLASRLFGVSDMSSLRPVPSSLSRRRRLPWRR
jgi:protein-tyrosine phosphatase